jgi:Ran GTPase-activating protein 1
MVFQLNISNNQLCGLNADGHGIYTAEGITAIADALRVDGALTALDLSRNDLKDEGVNAVCRAIQNSKETKLASLNFEYNGIGPVGANAVAAMVAVTGALTSVKLGGNKLGDEGWGAIFAAICGNKDSKMSLDASHQNIGLVGGKLIAEALRSTVTGALTQVLAF